MVELKQYEDALGKVIRSFRLGMEAMGSKELVSFIDLLMIVLPSGLAPEEMVRINYLLQEIFSAQARKDFLRIADLLEYEQILPTPLGNSPVAWNRRELKF